MKRATYYDILGLDQNAGNEEIKRSFRRLSLHYHPDRNPSNQNAHAIFIVINNAYQILINAQARDEYDAYLRRFEHKVYAAPRYAKAYDPLIRNALSEYNCLLWDLEDLLKIMTEEHFDLTINEVNLYEYMLNIFKYLEEEILGENDRFTSFSRKERRAKLHLENYYYLLRLEIEKHIEKMDHQHRSDPDAIKKMLDIKSRLMKCISEISRYI